MKTLRLLPALVTLALSASAMDLGTNFWNLKWHAPNDCFKDVNAVKGTDVWNPRFLENLKPFQSLRFMDWDATNNSKRKAWSERTQKGNPDQTVAAYEWMIDLCNRMNADLWVCLPHLAIDRTQGDKPSDYALRLAILIKHGVDMRDVDLLPLMDRLQSMSADALVGAGGVRTTPPLKPGLRVYFEYSNETWNSMFEQAHHTTSEGAALRLNPKPKLDEKGEDWVAAYRFHAWAAIRIFRAADLVFGADSPRLEKVLAGFTVEPEVLEQQLIVMADAKHNPWAVKATAIATAPYFGHKVEGKSADAAKALKEDIQRTVRESENHKKMADSAGLKLIAYEGGQHVLKDAEVINRDPAMYALYEEYLAEMSRFFEHFSHYCHVGQAGSGGAWGALEKTEQPLSTAHKQRALVDYTAKHPRKPLQARQQR